MLAGGSSLSDVDRKVLEILSGQLLVNKTELSRKLGSNGIDSSLGKLMTMGFVDKVESLGICYVITQQGIRAMKDEA
jgi:predicted transcriptional regulator